MSKKGLLVDYDYCTGCLTCEVACQQEHNYAPAQSGIKVTEHVTRSRKKPVFIVHQVFLTEWCVLCGRRTSLGELPSCVKHCPAKCLSYGTLGELAQEMEKRSKTALLRPL